ncbi:hypothetical protein, partial [Prevotella sp.]|uniref:hypothetical protein n=1 Tax=Prevotella sp. TaxID=59823 RepID=UPI0025FEE916
KYNINNSLLFSSSSKAKGSQKGGVRKIGLSLSPVTKFQKKQKAFLLGILFFLQKSLAFSNKRRNFAPENKTTSLWYT